MEKTIFSKKHALIKLSLVLLLVLFAFSFAIVQAVDLPVFAEDDANAELEGEYGFEVDLGRYVQGTFVRAKTVDQYPVFTLKFNNKSGLDDKRFWYGVSETPNVEDVDVWLVSSTYNATEGVGEIHTNTFARDDANNNGGIFKKYVFFRSGERSGTGSFYYSDMVVDLRIDNNATDEIYEIDSLVATYTLNGIETAYPYKNTDEKKWTSGPVTLKVTNDGGRFDNANFYYQLDGVDAEGNPYQPVMFEKVAVSQEGSDISTYYGQAVIPGPESGISSYEGKITVYATSFASPDERIVYDTEEINIYYDSAVPSFEVQGTSSAVDYVEGSWANNDITYVLKNTPVASGARYFCDVYVSGGQTETYEIQLQGSQYSYTVSREGITNVKFYAVSGSGVEYSTKQVTARIDKVKPTLNLEATDKYGAEIRTMGTAPGDYRVGYAKDALNFLLTNGSTQQQGNTVSYWYSDDGVDYEEIISISGNFRKTFTNTASETLLNKTYYFKVKTASGEEDSLEFTASILNSNYSVEMEVEELHFNTAGWLKEAVNVYFTVPSVLGIDNEYEIRGMVTGAPDTIKVLDATLVAGAPAGMLKYNVKIEDNLNNSSYSFEIYDKAQNKGGCVYASDGSILEETFFRTTQLQLDLSMPNATVTRHIKGTSIELATDDSWAAGEVLITITPDELISGVYCYPLVNGQPSAIGMVMENGSFTKTVGTSGAYSFRLRSGAGLEKDLTCQVNIDAREIITFEEIIVSTIDPFGNIIAEDIDENDPSLMIANDLKVSFVTDHNYLPNSDEWFPHYNFYYATFTGDEPALDASQYTLYVPGEGDDPFSFIAKIPQVNGGAQGYLKYSFYLVSKAVDTNENAIRTAPKYFSIQYDVRNFQIEVSYSELGNENQWVGTVPQFTLNLLQDSNANVNVTIDRYQYSLDGGNTWITIPGTASNRVDFDFEGVVQKVPVVDDLRSMDEDNTFSSYNGIIQFRALNLAGHTSQTLSCEVKMDTSTPNPLYAVRQRAGENVFDEVNRIYTIYSNQNVEYVQTGASISPVFLQKAPITYYYRLIQSTDPIKDGDSKVDQLDDPNVWRKLSGNETLVSGQYYWLVADNGMRQSSAYKIRVMKESSAPTAEFIGGVIGSEDGVYEFNWTQDRAEIQFKLTSESAVYIWYSLDGSEWAKVEERAIEINGTTYWTVAFVAPPTDGSEVEEDFVIVGNLKKTAQFKITNLAGSEYTIPGSVIIRIDNKDPVFNVDLSTATIDHIAEEDLSKFFNETIHIKVSPVEENQNPGGVEYTYKVAGASNYEKMAGSYITTEEILGYDGNGVLDLIIRAQARASLKTYEKHLVIKIDKVEPTFQLKGEVYKGGKATGQKIESGTWINADMVKISRVVEYTPISDVTYTIATTKEPVKNWEEGTSFEVSEIMTVYVTATSGSGLVVEKIFQVNIDNQAPIIDAGPIKNSDDPRNPNKYYIDQEITYREAYLKSATYNGFPLSNGHIIATNTVDNSELGPDGKTRGYVHIVVEDLAGNKTELKFYMTVFELTVNNIEINNDHIVLLNKFEASYKEALNKGSLSDSRAEYFATYIGRLWDRLATLQKEIDDYRAYLTLIEQRVSFDLVNDYPEMEKYLAYFISPDPLVRYPEWQQNKIKESPYDDYYAKLLVEYNKLNAHMSVVRDLEKQVIALPATNIVEEGDYQNVIRVFNAYQSLSNDQRAVFKSTLYTKLAELKRKCEVYLLQDSDTGIAIDGDHLVGEAVGVMLEVVNYAESTELFINAQKTLYETVSEGNPRKIISINKLGLTGYGSQYDTGEITITLPIPTEGEVDYTQYVYFAVYRLSPDGTLSPVKDVKRERDGKSVSFTSTTLDTYVLATTANVVVREEPEKIYGSVGGIEIDATLLTYITFAVVAMFVVFVVIIMLVAIRRRNFLRAYNRDHKNALQRRGITRIPKGNAPPISNPARPEERVGDTRAVYHYGKRKRRQTFSEPSKSLIKKECRPVSTFKADRTVLSFKATNLFQIARVRARNNKVYYERNCFNRYTCTRCPRSGCERSPFIARFKEERGQNELRYQRLGKQAF